MVTFEPSGDFRETRVLVNGKLFGIIQKYKGMGPFFYTSDCLLTTHISVSPEDFNVIQTKLWDVAKDQ